MKFKLHLLLYVCIGWLFTNASFAQNTTLSNDLKTYNLEQLEVFFGDNYSFSKVLKDLEVEKPFNNKKNINYRLLIYKRIRSFYKSIRKEIKVQDHVYLKEVEKEYQEFIAKNRVSLPEERPAETWQNPGQPNGPMNPNPTTPQHTPTSPCDNMGFENGNFDNWTLINGKVTGANPYSFVQTSIANNNSPGAQFTIETGGTDPIVGIPMVNPNGGGYYSCRLGDGTGIYAKAARIKRTFAVTNTNSIFSFSYAVVFQNPSGHSQSEKPYFSFRVKDQNNNNVNCAAYSVVAQGSIPGFQSQGSVKYKDWTTVIVDLTAYVGQNVTVVFTTGDCSQTGHYGYAYIDASCRSPHISIVNASGTKICPGGSVTLSAIGSTSNSDMTFDWSGPGVNNATTPTVEVTQSGDYSVTMSPPNSGAACAIGLDTTFTIEVVEPTADFYFDTVCENNPIHFHDASSVSPPGEDFITSWNWDFGDGTPLNNGTAPTHDYANGSSHDVKLVVETQLGCKDSITIPTEYLANPVADFTFDDACSGQDSLILTNTSLPKATGGVDCSWDLDNDGLTDNTGNTASHLFNTTGNKDIRLIVENSNGCVDTVKKQVMIYPTPQADFTTQPVCEDLPTAFTNTSTTNTTGGTQLQDYEWDFGNGNNSNAKDPSVVLGDENIYDVQLVAITNHGCKDTVVKQVKVYPKPDVGFIPKPVCIGFTSHFVDTSTISNDHTTNSLTDWEWHFGNGDIESGQTTTHLYDQVGSYNVTLVVTSAFGCVDSLTKQAIVYETPNPSIKEIPDACENGKPVKLVGVPPGGTFYGPGVINGSAFDPANKAVGNYTVMYDYIDPNGCEDSVKAQVTINPAPTAGFTPTYQEIQETEQVDFTNTSAGATSYYWTFGQGEGSSHDVNPSYVYDLHHAATYIVVLEATNKFGCTDTAQGKVKVIPAKIDFKFPNVFTPNGDGTNDVFKFVYHKNIAKVHIVILNRWGNPVYEGDLKNFKWDGRNHNKGVDCVDGTYYYKAILTDYYGKDHKAYGFLQLVRDAN